MDFINEGLNAIVQIKIPHKMSQIAFLFSTNKTKVKRKKTHKKRQNVTSQESRISVHQRALPLPEMRVQGHMKMLTHDSKNDNEYNR